MSRAGALVIRAFNPSAERVDVVHDGTATPMARVHPAGGFEATFPVAQHFDYRLRVIVPRRHAGRADDPYRYGRIITEYDIYLFGKASTRAFTTSSART